MTEQEIEIYFDLVDDGLITTETSKEEIDQMISVRLKGKE